MEYYFAEKEEEQPHESSASKSQKQRSSAGGTTKTTLDSMSEESNELTRVRRRFKRLEINSSDNDAMTLPVESSPKSLKTLKKRRYRQLERHNIDEVFEPLTTTAQIETGSNKKNRKTIKLNEKMLKKACATVDLIS